MKKITVFALAAGLVLPAFPVSAQYYTDNHSGSSASGHANRNAYEQMMNNIERGPEAAEDVSNPEYLQDRADTGVRHYSSGSTHDEVGNYGNVSGAGQESYHDRAETQGDTGNRSGYMSRGRDVFVSKEVNASRKQRERDLERGHDSNFQPVREDNEDNQ